MQERRWWQTPDEPAERRVRAPTIALVIVISLAMAVLVAVCVDLVLFDKKSPVIALILFLVVLLPQSIALYGCHCMWTLRRYDYAFGAAIFAMIPCVSFVFWIPGLIIGTWAIFVLREPRVRASFKNT